MFVATLPSMTVRAVTRERLIEFAETRDPSTKQALIDLAGKWRHNYIPLDAIAWEIKLKRRKGDRIRRPGAAASNRALSKMRGSTESKVQRMIAPPHRVKGKAPQIARPAHADLAPEAAVRMRAAELSTHAASGSRVARLELNRRAEARSAKSTPVHIKNMTANQMRAELTGKRTTADEPVPAGRPAPAHALHNQTTDALLHEYRQRPTDTVRAELARRNVNPADHGLTGKPAAPSAAGGAAEQIATARPTRKPSKLYLEYQAARQEQDRRYENQQNSTGIHDTKSHEYQAYFGEGEHAGSTHAVEQRITYKRFLEQRRNGSAHEKASAAAYDAGRKLGEAHAAAGMSGKAADAQYAASEAAHHADHHDVHAGGYQEGLVLGEAKAAKATQKAAAGVHAKLARNADRASARADSFDTAANHGSLQVSTRHRAAAAAHADAGRAALAAGNRDAAKRHLDTAQRHIDQSGLSMSAHENAQRSTAAVRDRAAAARAASSAEGKTPQVVGAMSNHGELVTVHKTNGKWRVKVDGRQHFGGHDTHAQALEAAHGIVPEHRRASTEAEARALHTRLQAEQETARKASVAARQAPPTPTDINARLRAERQADPSQPQNDAEHGQAASDWNDANAVHAGTADMARTRNVLQSRFTTPEHKAAAKAHLATLADREAHARIGHMTDEQLAELSPKLKALPPLQRRAAAKLMRERAAAKSSAAGGPIVLRGNDAVSTSTGQAVHSAPHRMGTPVVATQPGGQPVHGTLVGREGDTLKVEHVTGTGRTVVGTFHAAHVREAGPGDRAPVPSSPHAAERLRAAGTGTSDAPAASATVTPVGANGYDVIVHHAGTDYRRSGGGRFYTAPARGTGQPVESPTLQTRLEGAHFAALDKYHAARGEGGTARAFGAAANAGQSANITEAQKAARAAEQAKVRPVQGEMFGASGEHQPDLFDPGASRPKYRYAEGDRIQSEFGPATVTAHTDRSVTFKTDSGESLNIARGTPGYDRLKKLDTAAAPKITVEHSGDGTVVHGTERGDTEAINALKAQGFKWSRNLGGWYLPRTWSAATREQRVRGLESRLGTRLEVQRGDLTASGTAAERAQSQIDRAHEIAAQQRARAEKLRAESDAQHEASRRVLDNIPFGQPILVGHHSERGHRRALDRAHNAMGKSVEAQRAAEAADQRAQSAEARAAMATDPRAAARRLKRDEAELRDIERKLNGTSMNGMAYGQRASGEWAQRLTARRTELQAKIEHERSIAAPALAGPGAGAKPGDVVKIRGELSVVTGGGKKNVKVLTSVGHLSYPRDQIQAHRDFSTMSTAQLEALIESTRAPETYKNQARAVLAKRRAGQ